jgi:hypothetical protein
MSRKLRKSFVGLPNAKFFSITFQRMSFSTATGVYTQIPRCRVNERNGDLTTVERHCIGLTFALVTLRRPQWSANIQLARLELANTFLGYKPRSMRQVFRQRRPDQNPAC